VQWMKHWAYWSETLKRARRCAAASVDSDRFASGRTGSSTNWTNNIVSCASWPFATAPSPIGPTHAERSAGKDHHLVAVRARGKGRSRQDVPASVLPKRRPDAVCGSISVDEGELPQTVGRVVRRYESSPHPGG